MNFDWFMERLESFLAVEQRVRWCAVGVVDITSFKWYNDNLGHSLGDRIIEQVARILAEKLRSEDLLAQERPQGGRDLHARFGGDEFCFLIPDLPGPDVATLIADRFKQATEGYDWRTVHDGLSANPVRVDVGIVSLQLGPVSNRRSFARKLATELMHQADILMYGAKGKRAGHVYPLAVRIEQGQLVAIGERPAISLRRQG
jgi:diguanylate cyclase (GGDEF)-like protein